MERNWVIWLTAAILAFRKFKHEDYQEFKGTLAYTVRPHFIVSIKKNNQNSKE